MAETRVDVFLYGSFMSRQVLARMGATLEQGRVGRLWGFTLQMQPHANLVSSDQHCAYGVVGKITHRELGLLYGQGWVSSYLPQAVLVQSEDGQLIPALCYIAPPSRPAAAESEYLATLLSVAHEYKFPAWYISQLEAFRPSPGEETEAHG